MVVKIKHLKIKSVINQSFRWKNLPKLFEFQALIVQEYHSMGSFLKTHFQNLVAVIV